jgi:hypothetical protein
MNELYIPDIPSNFRYISVISFYFSFLIPFIKGFAKTIILTYVLTTSLCGLLREIYFLKYNFEKMLVYYAIPLVIIVCFYEKNNFDFSILLYIPILVYLVIIKIMRINLLTMYSDFYIISPIFLLTLTLIYIFI